jgi:predicted DNA-binding protein
MAELIHTVSFRVKSETYQRLQDLAEDNNRKLGDVVRIIVEEMLVWEARKSGKVQPDHHST